MEKVVMTEAQKAHQNLLVKVSVSESGQTTMKILQERELSAGNSRIFCMFPNVLNSKL